MTVDVVFCYDWWNKKSVNQTQNQKSIREKHCILVKKKTLKYLI